MDLMSNNLWRVKVGLAEMLKGGVIMDVTTAAQAKIAEDAGACAVMALERVPADIRKEGGVARMAAPKIIREIMDVVSIPVMAKVRIGHFAEAQVLEALEVDYIDESEVLTPADEEHHVWKHGYKVPFVCAFARNLGKPASAGIAEGASMIRTKGEAGLRQYRRRCATAVRAIIGQMKKLTMLGEEGTGCTNQKNSARLSIFVLGWPSTASCQSRISQPVVSPLLPTQRSSCNSAPKRSSSVPASSSQTIQPSALAPS